MGGVNGVVAAGHPLTARAGAEVLADGGNAVDAAVAAAFSAAVCESALTGPGAGGYMLYAPVGREAVALDFFVAAPGLDPATPPLTEAMMEAFVVPFGGADQVFHIGPASVAVPGMVRGLCEAAERYGRLPLTRLVEPAVALAREGVEVGVEVATLFRVLGAMLVHTPECAAVYAPGGTLAAAGDRLTFGDLAHTLEHIGRTGPSCMDPGGWLGDAIVEHLAGVGGRVTRADLAAYRVACNAPIRRRFRGLDLRLNPPSSGGGALIAAALAALDERPPPSGEVAYYAAVAWAGEVANAVRADAFSGGLRAHEMPPAAWDEVRRRAAAMVSETRKPAGSTTHVSVVDADGAMEGLSSSNGAASGVVVPGTGVLLNNMMGEEDLNPGGFGGVAAGERLASMMAPVVALRDGVPEVCLGAAGSNRLRSAITQTLVSIVDDGMGVAAAAARPRVHPEGGGLDVEGGVSSAICAALEGAGHTLRRWDAANLFFGGVSAVTHRAGIMDGAGDPRRGGGAYAALANGEVERL